MGFWTKFKTHHLIEQRFLDLDPQEGIKLLRKRKGNSSFTNHFIVIQQSRDNWLTEVRLHTGQYTGGLVPGHGSGLAGPRDRHRHPRVSCALLQKGDGREMDAGWSLLPLKPLKRCLQEGDQRQRDVTIQYNDNMEPVHLVQTI